MMKLYVFSWLFFAVQREMSAILRLKGTENEQLNFTCSHSWAATNIKYFCRLECRDQDVLIRSVGVGRIAKKDRYSLYDRGGRFTVSINRLQKSDEGKYWCGVERAGIDTYHEVVLKVLDAPQVTATFQTSLLTTFGPGISVKARHNYISVCVFGLLIILVLSLALHYNQVKTCHVLTDCLSASSSNASPRGTGHNRVSESSSGDQNPNAINLVYVNHESNLSQSNQVYQTLHIKAIQIDSVYETMFSSTDQSDE
ncbi:CMRF35-like molecule 7 [Ictalurus furcatus]|uniref:CMRF35-like molecule 7 n=1 Tax=Ictalurus furcatus TaxID=66913 RepID=UPI00234FCF0A|nr:CMRF35-like molecule 7 [Ictalurus furcatus]